MPVPVGGKWKAGAVWWARDAASGTAREMFRRGEREARTRSDGTLAELIMMIKLCVQGRKGL
jgi:hypothetical protein